MTTYVLAYGTLKKGRGNHSVLGNSRYVDEVLTNSMEFVMYDGGFPYVSDDIEGTDKNGRIFGELYEVVDERTMANLDRLEGVPTLYVKREVDVTSLSGDAYKATIYVASRGTNTRLKEREPMEPKGRHRVLEWDKPRFKKED